MKKLICAGVALSSLFCAEQGWGLDVAFDALQKYENYEHKTTRDVKDRQDTIDRYQKEMKTYNGSVRIEISEDGKTLNVWRKTENGGWDCKSTNATSNDIVTVMLDGYDFISWYKNSLILVGSNITNSYSFLADRIYIFGDLKCDSLVIGAREGFVNFADINASHVKVFTHAGQDCGNIITSSETLDQNSGYDEDVVENFFVSCNGNNKILDTAFSNGWKSVGSLRSKSVLFDGLSANIHGSLSAESVTMQGKGNTSDGADLPLSLLIGNPYVSEDFSNTWLDWLRSKEAFNKAVVKITNLNMQNGATVTVPNAVYDDDENCVKWGDDGREVNIENINGAKVKNCEDSDHDFQLVDFLKRIKVGRTKNFHIKRSSYNQNEGKIGVSCFMGKERWGRPFVVYFKKVGNGYRFFDGTSRYRFYPGEEEKLKYYLIDNPVLDDDEIKPDDDDSDNGGGGHSSDDDDDNTKPEDPKKKHEVKKKEQNQQQKRPSKQQKTFDSLEEFVVDANRNNRYANQFSCYFRVSNALKKVVNKDSNQALGSISCDAGIFPGLSGQRVKFERNEEGELVFSDEFGNKFSEKVQIFLTNLCRELKRNDQGFGANDDSEGAPKPEKRDITKKHSSEADLTDPTVRQMDDWANTKDKLSFVGDCSEGLRKLQRGEINSLQVSIGLPNTAGVISLLVSYIKTKSGGKFVFNTASQKKLSDKSQERLRKEVVEAQINLTSSEAYDEMSKKVKKFNGE